MMPQSPFRSCPIHWHHGLELAPGILPPQWHISRFLAGNSGWGVLTRVSFFCFLVCAFVLCKLLCGGVSLERRGERGSRGGERGSTPPLPKCRWGGGVQGL